MEGYVVLSGWKGGCGSVCGVFVFEGKEKKKRRNEKRKRWVNG